MKQSTHRSPSTHAAPEAQAPTDPVLTSTGIPKARRCFRSLQGRALEMLAAHLAPRAVLPKDHPWLESGDRGSGENPAGESAPLPSRGDLERPFTVQLCVNRLCVPHLEPEVLLAGVEGQVPQLAPSDIYSRLLPRFELSCAPHEAVAYATWLSKVLQAFDSKDFAAIPLPPFTTYFWRDETLDCRCALSRNAWEAITQYYCGSSTGFEPFQSGDSPEDKGDA